MWSDFLTDWTRVSHRTIALAALAVGLLAAAPERALADSNPFAGRYTSGEQDISISATGSIRVKIGMQTLFTGHVADDGSIALTFTIGSVFGDMWMRGSHGGGGGKGNPVTVYGVAALDADGNLYGVVTWLDGSPMELFWTRSDH